MGSRSHSRDLEIAAPAIATALHRFPNARFELFGSIEPPAMLAGVAARHHRKVKNYSAFLRTLAGLDWSFGLAPLIVDDFTRMKSNVKWIEYTAAAIPVIASDHPIYAECCSGGAGLLAAPDGWLPAIESMMESPDLRADVARQALLRLRASYAPERLRAQILTVFSAAGMPSA
jgi:glycosyltransferase involved in cell wall biosynthesis